MKTLLTIALAMSMYLGTYASPTNELAALSRVSHEHQNAKVTLYEGLGRVKISVFNAKGIKLNAISLKVSQNVVLPINMEALPEGNYVIRIQSKDSSIDYPVETKAKKVEEIGFKANVKGLGEKHVLVSVYELNGEGLTVKIYDEEDRLLHKEYIEGGPFARKYEMKNRKAKGMYFVLMDKNGKQQFYNI